MTALSPPVRRLVAVGLLALVVTTVFRLAVQPAIAAFLEQRQRLVQQRELIVQFQRIAARRPALEDRLSALEQDLRTTGIFLSPGVESVVAARLQNRVKALVEENGGVMQSAQVLPVVDEGGFRRIALRVRLTANIIALNRCAHALESGAPYLIIDNVDINAQQINIQESKQKEWDLMFSILFDVYGYIQPA